MKLLPVACCLFPTLTTKLIQQPLNNKSIVGAGLGTKFSYLPINEQQNPPFPTDK